MRLNSENFFILLNHACIAIDELLNESVNTVARAYSRHKNILIIKWMRIFLKINIFHKFVSFYNKFIFNFIDIKLFQ